MGKTHVVIVGNPGRGKSFILNSLIGRVCFKSGLSIVDGLTQVMQRYDARDYVYFDTPGLDNKSRRKMAGREISKALEGGCTMKLIFVVTLESGRVNPADLTTLDVVLKGIQDEGVVTKAHYLVMINKCSPNLMEEVQKMRPHEEYRAQFGGAASLRNLEFFPRIDDAEDVKNHLHLDNSGFDRFVHNAPTMNLPVNANVKIDVRNIDEIIIVYEEELKKMERKLEELRAEPDDDRWKTKVAGALSLASLATGAATFCTIF